MTTFQRPLTWIAAGALAVISLPAMAMEPTAATVAGEEPDSAANSMHASTAPMARPPRIWPTQALAKSIRRRATPPVVMNAPDKRKNGIASRV